MKHNNKHTPAATPHITTQDLELVAEELVELAKGKLKDGHLNDILPGLEPDIRQEAVILALQWWLKPKAKHSGRWNPRRSISYALNFIKLRYLERAERKPECSYHEEWDYRSTPHPHCLNIHQYPEHSLLWMFSELIKQCLQKGTISIPNALIATMVYIEGMTIGEVARSMGIHSSAVNQQLRRVRLAVRHAAKTTDPTFVA